MKKLGIVSYNIYGNFTNYGSALQTYALQRVLNGISPKEVTAVVIDYCPKHLLDADPLNPMKMMWDKDEESRRLCEMMKPALKINFDKFNAFFQKHYHLSKGKYTAENFESSWNDEGLDGYVCGSDTIFCVDEGGFEPAFFADFECMKSGRSIAYAASFGDTTLNPEVETKLGKLLGNFKWISLREYEYLDFVKNITTVPLEKVIDPTLLLSADDYEEIIAQPQENEPYLLLYSRRYNSEMESFARKKAKENNLKLVEISIRAENAKLNEMRYDAGVEEFLSLVKDATIVVTNSFHGLIFSAQFRTPFYVFGRELGNSKIQEVLRLFGVEDRLLTKAEAREPDSINFDDLHKNIAQAREDSMNTLRRMLSLKQL